MPATTKGFRYPAATDRVADGATAIQNLATDLDTWQGAWQDFAPADPFSALTEGNGVLYYRYRLEGNAAGGKTVHGVFHFVLGSTSAITAGIAIVLPVAPKLPAGTPRLPANFMGEAFDFSAGSRYMLSGELTSTNLILLTPTATPGLLGNVTAAAPFAFAVSDVISGQFSYEAA